VTLAYADLTRDNAAALESVLLGRVWAQHWTAELAHQVVEWRYWRRPAGQTLLALEEGRCVGLIDSFMRPYVVSGRHMLVRETCDWWSEPRLRPTGVGLRLIRQLMTGVEPLISIGGSQLNVELLPRLKWRCIGEVKKWILPLRARDLAAVALRRQRHETLARLVPGFVRMRRLRAVSPPAASAHVGEWRPGHGPPLPQPRTRGIAAVIDEAHLQWLCETPTALAEVDALTFSVERTPVGFAIMQFEPTPLGAEGKIVHLQLAEESSTLYGWMLTELVQRLAHAGAGLVRVRSASRALDGELRRAGFLVVRPEPVYWWGRNGPYEGAPLQLSYLRADDAIPYGAAGDNATSRNHRSSGS
jgi:hypothetical protein